MSYYAFDELLSSGPFAIIELFELQLFQELHNDDGRYYFHAGRNRKTTEPGSGEDPIAEYSIRYQGQTYLPLPIEASGFEYKGDGSLPRPTIRIANLRSEITGLLLSINQVTPGNDLNGAKVTRIRTLSRFLDSDNWENNVNPYGNPDDSANAQLPQEVYYIDRKVIENRDFVEFELSSALDLTNLKTPRRLAMQNLCQWEYKSKECGYSGADEFTVGGTQVTVVAAPNFTYSSNNTLGSSSSLNSADGDELVSSNGWYKLTIDSTGRANLLRKDGVTVWQTANGPGPNENGYELRLNSDGNLVVYNKDLARDDYENGSVIWVSNSFRLGSLTALNRLTLDGLDQWWPDDVNKGRSGAFTWELVGSSPTAAGQTTTATKNFVDTDPLSGDSRSVNITFNLTSLGLGANRYFSNNSGYTGFSWNQIDSITINSFTGLWRHKYDYIAKLTLSSNNPFRDNHPTEGTLTEAGAYYTIESTNWRDSMRLVLQDTGRLEIEKTDSSFTTWIGYSGSSTEPKVTTETNTPSVTVSGQCGKRVSDCRLRFPNGDASGGLPFGSFPALGNNF